MTITDILIGGLIICALILGRKKLRKLNKGCNGKCSQCDKIGCN